MRDIVGVTNKQIKSLVSVIFYKMSLYLANKDTEYILFRPVKVSAMTVIMQAVTATPLL